MIVFPRYTLPPLRDEYSVRLDEVMLAQPVEDTVDFDAKGFAKKLGPAMYAFAHRCPPVHSK